MAYNIPINRRTEAVGKGFKCMDETRQATLRKINKLLSLASDAQVQRIYRIIKYMLFSWPPDRA